MMNGRPDSTDGIATLPKVELHVHMEGAIPLTVLWERIVRHGGDQEVRDLDALRERFHFRDFHHFIATWVWKNRFLRDEADFIAIGAAFAQRCVDEHILYCEAHLSPIDASAHGLDIPAVIRAVRTGLNQVPQAQVALIIDVVRDYGPERAQQTLAALESVRDCGVVGIGLGGNEREHPPELFASIFANARERGWHRSVHAGETAGPDSVRTAVLELHAERIGHGIRAIEDPSLMHLLGERGVALEVCPTSNVRTGVVARLDQHPIAHLRAAGLRVTVNSDDPTFFHCSLTSELRLLHDNLGWTPATLRDLQLVAANNAFLTADARAALLAQLRGDPGWQTTLSA